MLCSSFLVCGELIYLFFDFRRNSSSKMVNNSQMWMVILIAFLLLFCLDVKVSQMEKRNAQLNTQCDISVFTETEIGKQDKSFQNIKWCEYIIWGWGHCSALCVQIDFMRTFETTTKCNNMNNVGCHFFKSLAVLKHNRRL